MNFLIENKQLIAQCVGFLAMFVALAGYVQKDDTKIKKIFMVSTSIWILHFILMGMFSAVAACCMGLVRIFLSLKYQRNKRIFFGVLAATITLGVWTMDGHISLLPIIGSCISAYGFFFYERLKLRIFMLISSMFWFSFNLSIQSIGGIINDMMVQSMLIITMVKMLHEEHKRTFIVDKVMTILEKRHDMHMPDLGRYISIADYVRSTKKWLEKIIEKEHKIYHKLFVKHKKDIEKMLEEVFD